MPTLRNPPDFALLTHLRILVATEEEVNENGKGQLSAWQQCINGVTDYVSTRNENEMHALLLKICAELWEQLASESNALQQYSANTLTDAETVEKDVQRKDQHQCRMLSDILVGRTRSLLQIRQWSEEQHRKTLAKQPMS